MSGTKRYAKGTILTEKTGYKDTDREFYRIMDRKGEWAIIRHLQTLLENGKAKPGPADPLSKSFRKKIQKQNGRDIGFPIVHNAWNYVGWARMVDQRGGKRKGAGRPKGTFRGVKTKTVSISMPKEKLDQIDRERGKMPRGKYLAKIHDEILLKKNLTSRVESAESPESGGRDL